ncbi:MAG: NAD(P)/FAD-dependent oxidoreductase, partial [Hymenobacter sp.]|nr:NAD(P)/FAD-dependent oxidoreductase [Hymenobacter sp.]
QRHFGQTWNAQQADWWAHSQRVLIDNFGAQPQIPLQADAVLLPEGAASGPLSYDLAALLRPMDEAISTAGGIAFAAVDEHLMLRQRPGTFVAGEMLDWEAPTGGYLLQGCFSTGAWAAHGVTLHF